MASRYNHDDHHHHDNNLYCIAMVRFPWDKVLLFLGSLGCDTLLASYNRYEEVVILHIEGQQYIIK